MNGAPLKRYAVTARAVGNPDHCVTVAAADEFKAHTRAMVDYPHPLRGALVTFDAVELPDPAPLVDGFTYRTEFPDFPPETMPPIPPHWRDSSWHNDACPSFQVSPSLCVFVDFADPARSDFAAGRADGSFKRFQLGRLVDGEHPIEGGAGVAESDDWNEILAAIAADQGGA